MRISMPYRITSKLKAVLQTRDMYVTEGKDLLKYFRSHEGHKSRVIEPRVTPAFMGTFVQKPTYFLGTTYAAGQTQLGFRALESRAADLCRSIGCTSFCERKWHKVLKRFPSASKTHVPMHVHYLANLPSFMYHLPS